MAVTGIPRALLYEGTAIHRLITDEIATLREQQQVLKKQGRTGIITAVILVLCVAANVAALILLPEYPAFFITASCYLYMVYFITLLIPLGRGTFRFPLEEIRQFFSTLYTTGIIQTTDRFARIFLDAFFINSRALCSGFVLIFSLDIVYALAWYHAGMIPPPALQIILFQAVAILVFYFFLWRFEPGTTQFREEIRGIRGAFTGKWYPSWAITLLFGTAALLVLLVIISTIILLPGMTVQTFLSLSGLKSVEHFFIVTGLLLVSQYFIVRFFHGIASERMAAQFSEIRITALQSVDEKQEPAGSPDNGSEGFGKTMSEEEMRNAAGALLESRIYRLDRQTLWGTFPVFLVNLDFSVVFDKQVLGAITGYLKGAGLRESHKEE